MPLGDTGVVHEMDMVCASSTIDSIHIPEDKDSVVVSSFVDALKQANLNLKNRKCFSYCCDEIKRFQI